MGFNGRSDSESVFERLRDLHTCLLCLGLFLLQIPPTITNRVCPGGSAHITGVEVNVINQAMPSRVRLSGTVQVVRLVAALRSPIAQFGASPASPLADPALRKHAHVFTVRQLSLNMVVLHVYSPVGLALSAGEVRHDDSITVPLAKLLGESFDAGGQTWLITSRI